MIEIIIKFGLGLIALVVLYHFWRARRRAAVRANYPEGKLRPFVQGLDKGVLDIQEMPDYRTRRAFGIFGLTAKAHKLSIKDGKELEVKELALRIARKIRKYRKDI